MWGFDLDMTAVRLMRRDNGKWQEVAAEKIEGADIEQRLMALVERIENDAPVDLFLPRDQILYTDVEVTSEDRQRDQILKALEGATPYPTDELDIDWEMTGPTTARVAAIALETLDEAVAFAEVRGIKVGGFSSLDIDDNFPRPPDFTGHSIFYDDDPEDDVVAAPVTFTSARVVSKPRPYAGSLSPVAPEAEPVVKVDDDAPVMRVKAPAAPPLDPGRPLSAPTTAPRVRTDIAAQVVSEQVASLTPPAVKVRSGPAFWKVGAVLALALLVTVGVATLVWKLLPLGPGSTGIPVTEESGAVAPAEVVQPVETATAPAEEVTVVEPSTDTALAPANAAPESEAPIETALAPVAVEPEETPAEVAPVPDLPLPVFASDVLVPEVPKTGTPPQIAALTPVDQTKPPRFRTALRAGEGLPFVDLGLPGEPTPAALANILTSAPGLAPAPNDAFADASDNIYLASVDQGELSFDAIALPNPARLAASALPITGAAPELVPDTPSDEQVASLDTPDITIETPLSEPTPAEPEVAETPSGLPAPTELARALTDRAPRARPSGFVEAIERQAFGGLTRTELAEVRPPPRPASAQSIATEAAERAATELAVNTSPEPRGRPQDFDAIVAVAIVQRQAAQVTASLDYQTPNTSAAIEAALENDAEPEPAPAPSLSIPSSASVARQATIENAIRLNKVNLVGVYGTASDRRALVRLPSGRYVKVKVGDRVDGGTVAQITDDELFYKKGRRTLSLSLPKG